MAYYGDADIPMLLREFGQPVTIGGVDGIGIVDEEDQAFATSDSGRGEVVIGITAILVQTTAFPDLKIDQPIVWAGGNYSVREGLRVDDGAFTRVLLGSGPVPAPGGSGPQNVIDGNY